MTALITKMEQKAKVLTGETDQDETGFEWEEAYVLYEVTYDNGDVLYEIWHGDREGMTENQICKGGSLLNMQNIILRLGDLIEWKAGVPVRVALG